VPCRSSPPSPSCCAASPPPSASPGAGPTGAPDIINLSYRTAREDGGEEATSTQTKGVDSAEEGLLAHCHKCLKLAYAYKKKAYCEKCEEAGKVNPEAEKKKPCHKCIKPHFRSRNDAFCDKECSDTVAKVKPDKLTVWGAEKAVDTAAVPSLGLWGTIYRYLVVANTW
jgi:hypothetical protein